MYIVENRRKYNIFDQKLAEINKKYITPDDECKKYKADFNALLECFRKELYKNAFLQKHHEIIYTGSVYDDLAVGKVYQEFDLDFLINLYPNGVSVKNNKAGFVSFQINDPTSFIQSGIYSTIEKWLDSNKFLVPFKFRQWAEGVMKKTIDSCNAILNKKYLLKEKKSGPAFTIRVENLQTRRKYEVDVVFAIKILNSWPFSFARTSDSKWIAVSKTPHGETETTSIHWRYSFNTEERRLLNGQYHLKNVVRLLKRVRDMHEMTYIASHWIKTLVLLELKEKGSTYWQNNSLSWLFVKMLEKFNSALASGKIPFYWENKVNLLDNTSRHRLDNGHRRLTKILKDIEVWTENKTPDKIESLFVKQEKIAYSLGMADDNTFLDIPNMSGTSLGIMAGIAGVAIAVGGLLGLFSQRKNNRR